MRQLTWLDLIEDCFEAPEYVLGATPGTLENTKVMIRMAFRIATPEAEVAAEIAAWLKAQNVGADILNAQLLRFPEIWKWARPLVNDQADENLENARVLLKDLQYQIKGSSLSVDERSAMNAMVHNAMGEIKAAREFYGMQMQSAESELEVDPASGREVHVVKGSVN